MKNQNIRLIWDWLHPRSFKQHIRNRSSNPRRRNKSGRRSPRHCKQTSGHPARLLHSKSKVTRVRRSLNLCQLLRPLLSWTTEFNAPTVVVSLKSKWPNATYQLAGIQLISRSLHQRKPWSRTKQCSAVIYADDMTIVL
jgi:hypothetical protein